MEEPIWVSKAAVVAIHSRQLAEHGGGEGVRDPGLLESALALPRNLFDYQKDADASSLAASYAFGISRNHPFVDGNKRTAAVVCELFLTLNGWRLTATNDDLYVTFLALADGTLGEEELAEWLKRNIVAE